MLLLNMEMVDGDGNRQPPLPWSRFLAEAKRVAGALCEELMQDAVILETWSARGGYRSQAFTNRESRPNREALRAERHAAGERGRTLEGVLVNPSPLQPSEADLREAYALHASRPFMRCWIALKEGEQTAFILKPTAHAANKLAREGWTIFERKRG